MNDEMVGFYSPPRLELIIMKTVGSLTWHTGLPYNGFDPLDLTTRIRDTAPFLARNCNNNRLKVPNIRPAAPQSKQSLGSDKLVENND